MTRRHWSLQSRYGQWVRTSCDLSISVQCALCRCPLIACCVGA